MAVMHLDEPRSPVWGPGLLAALLLAGIIGLVSVVRTPAFAPASAPPVDATTKVVFDYAPWARVLKTHVNAYGMVDYAAVKAHPQDLNQFLQQVATYSPDRYLATFTTEQQGLAYWINAYNAWMVKAVIEAYPLTSVQKIGAARGAVFAEKTRSCGGVNLSLNDIESRARQFGNPGVHFALNCASLGCPPMSRQPFLPETLEAQLQHVTRDALRRQWYCHLADNGKTVKVTTIVKWYADDILEWQRTHGEPATVEAWLASRTPPKVSAALNAKAKLDYIPYDWRLNDQRAKWGKAKRN
jgi:hypothetical protein